MEYISERIELVIELKEIIHYLGSIDDVVTFIQINKKCQEATTFIKYFSKKKNT